MTAITPIYAALLTALFMVLSFRVIFYRRANLISLGDNDDKALRKRMRAQANFVEYTPLALILFLLVEMIGAPGWLVHFFAASFLLGRVMHAIGFSSTPQKMPLRFWGMILTTTSMAAAALALIWLSVL